MAADSFEKLEIDPIHGSALLHAMDIHPEEYEHEGVKFMKVLEVIDFMKDYDNATAVIERITRGLPKEDKLDRIHGFVQLQKKRSDVKQELQDLEQQIERYETV